MVIIVQLLFIIFVLWLLNTLSSGLRGIIVIIGLFAVILAAIAVPMHITYPKKERTSLVRMTLGKIAVAEEKYMEEHNTYANDLNLLDISIPPEVQVVIVHADTECYSASATSEIIETIWSIDCYNKMESKQKDET